jgi:hypothetical protein
VGGAAWSLVAWAFGLRRRNQRTAAGEGGGSTGLPARGALWNRRDGFLPRHRAGRRSDRSTAGGVSRGRGTAHPPRRAPRTRLLSRQELSARLLRRMSQLLQRPRARSASRSAVGQVLRTGRDDRRSSRGGPGNGRPGACELRDRYRPRANKPERGHAQSPRHRSRRAGDSPRQRRDLDPLRGLGVRYRAHSERFGPEWA